MRLKDEKTWKIYGKVLRVASAQRTYRKWQGHFSVFKNGEKFPVKNEPEKEGNKVRAASRSQPTWQERTTVKSSDQRKLQECCNKEWCHLSYLGLLTISFLTCTVHGAEGAQKACHGISAPTTHVGGHLSGFCLFFWHLTQVAHTVLFERLLHSMEDF
jgi:hypothetical protein